MGKIEREKYGKEGIEMEHTWLLLCWILSLWFWGRVLKMLGARKKSFFFFSKTSNCFLLQGKRENPCSLFGTVLAVVDNLLELIVVQMQNESESLGENEMQKEFQLQISF